MIRKFKRAWVKALRSGKYKQTTGTLCRTDADGKVQGYCCLGVLCEVAKKEGEPIKSRKADYSKQYVFDDTFEDGVVLSTCLGITLRERMKISDVIESNLMSMNDSGKSFDEIADYIEKNL